MAYDRPREDTACQGVENHEGVAVPTSQQFQLLKSTNNGVVRVRRRIALAERQAVTQNRLPVNFSYTYYK